MDREKGVMPRNLKVNSCSITNSGFNVKVGYATAAAEEISGDAAISCGLPDGSLALILSDGMGTGINAAAGSKLVVRRLRRNLKSGMAAGAAIKEVNRYMIRTEEKAAIRHEDFATVDLALIDRQSLRAKFYKMGAATSFIVRDGRVREIRGAALPVGLLPKVRLNRVTTDLKEGDIVVMVSDGITEADKADLQAGWLHIFLEDLAVSTEIKKFSPKRAASDILNEAILRYGRAERDDLTAAVAVITDSSN